MIWRIDLLDFGELPRAFLDPRADAHAHVHQDPAVVDRGEEIAPDEGRQRESADHEGEEAGHERRAVPIAITKNSR